MNNDYIPKNKIESVFNLCVEKGICPTTPALSFLQEVLITYIQELAFYLLKLKRLGITNEEIKDKIIEIISSITINLEYEHEYFLNALSKIYSGLCEAKDLYKTICQDRNLKYVFLSSDLKNPKKLNFVKVIKLGQKLSVNKFKNYNEEQKKFIDLISNIVKSICVHLVELRELEQDDERGYLLLLHILKTKIPQNTPTSRFKRFTEKICQLDNSLLRTLQKAREERYGNIVPVEVNTSTRPNKVILASGNNLRELELLLEATKGRNIDIYTHGNMLAAHTFPKFKKYPHLVGHWGKSLESHLLDFAEFPGAIFITKHSFQQIEHLFRSRIFTADIIAPKGVGVIKHNNFEPLIKSALDAKGFIDSRIRTPIKTSFDEKRGIEKISQIITKIKTKEITNLLVIGVSNNTKKQKEYFDKFLTLIDKKCFVISFSYYADKENILLVDSDYSFPLGYKLLDLITKEISLAQLNPTIMLTRCEVHTLSNIIYMKKLGIKNIYFTECQPTLINPAIIQSIQGLYDLKTYTNPENDYRQMLIDGKIGK